MFAAHDIPLYSDGVYSIPHLVAALPAPAAPKEPSDSLLFLNALRKAKEESLKEMAAEDNNKKRLEDRIRPYNLFVNPDTDNTGDCQFDAAADQLAGLPGHESLTKEIVRRTVTDWLRQNPNYRLSHDPANTDTLSTWIRDTQGLDWHVYVDQMAQPRVWGDEVTMKALVEAYQVKVLLWSSTVSEDNFFSVHHPKAEGSEVGTLCLCHFLEVHYGSLLSKLEFARRQAEKREAFIRIAQHLPLDVRVEALSDVFVHDNARVGSAAPLSRGAVVAALDAVGGSVQLAFERLSATLGLASDVELVMALHRVKQYRTRLPPGHLELALPRQHEQRDPAAAKIAELERELSKACALVQVLKDELAAVRDDNAALRSVANNSNNSGGNGDGVAGAAAADEPRIVCDTIVDEDGKKWVRAHWSLRGAALAPQCGDMVALQRLALHGVQAKLVGRLPASGAAQGATLFECPAGIAHYQVTYSRKGAELLRSAPFIVGPQVVLRVNAAMGTTLQLHWTMTDASIATTSDWVALYKRGETAMRNYETYAFINPTTNVVNLEWRASDQPVVLRFFSAENKYYPLAELDYSSANK